MDEFISTPLDSLTGLRVLSNAAIITVHSVVFFALIVGLPDWCPASSTCVILSSCTLQAT